jgi:hypothetical protein
MGITSIIRYIVARYMGCRIGECHKFLCVENIVIFSEFCYSVLFALVASTALRVPQTRGDNSLKCANLYGTRKQVVASAANQKMRARP